MTFLAPLYEDALTYPARSMRLGSELQSNGAGVEGFYAWRVSQRAAGANQSADIAPGYGWIRHTSPLARGGIYNAYNDAIVNVAASTPHASLPRIDAVVIQVTDSSDAGDATNLAAPVWLSGTATSGANLTNLSGAAGTPNNSELVAYVLRPAASANVTSANILDVRRCPIPGVMSAFGLGQDHIQPQYPQVFGPYGALAVGTYSAALRVYVPRRIKASNLRWKYNTTATAPTGGNWQFALYPAAGLYPAAYTASTAYAAGSTNQQFTNNVALSGTPTLEPGNYILWFSSSLTGNAVAAWGLNIGPSGVASGYGLAPSVGIGWYAASASLPSPFAGMADLVTANIATSFIVPFVTIGS